MLNRDGERESGRAAILDVMNTNDADARYTKMVRMGAVNLDPPLPRSKYIKVLKTGRVMPWNDLLAEQPHNEVACCDEYGNTDPAAWAADVQPVTDGEPDSETIALQARLALLARQHEYEQGPTMGDTPLNRPAYPDGVVAYQDADQLIAQLK